MKLRNSEGTWVEDKEEVIMEEICVFYSRLFGVGREDRHNGMEGQEILDCLPRDITDHVNKSLTKEITDVQFGKQ